MIWRRLGRIITAALIQVGELCSHTVMKDDLEHRAGGDERLLKAEDHYYTKLPFFSVIPPLTTLSREKE